MIKPEDIEIRSARFKTIDNGKLFFEVEWTTPEIFPNIRVGLYSLSHQKYKEYVETHTLWDWFKEVIYGNYTEEK